MESVILGSPILLVCYGIAVLLCVIDLVQHATGYVFTILSVAVFVAASAYGLLVGVPLTELAVVTFILLALNLISYNKKAGGHK